MPPPARSGGCAAASGTQHTPRIPSEIRHITLAMPRGGAVKSLGSSAAAAGRQQHRRCSCPPAVRHGVWSRSLVRLSSDTFSRSLHQFRQKRKLFRAFLVFCAARRGGGGGDGGGFRLLQHTERSSSTNQENAGLPRVYEAREEASARQAWSLSISLRARTTDKSARIILSKSTTAFNDAQAEKYAQTPSVAFTCWRSSRGRR